MIVADTCIIFHLFNETSLTFKTQRILETDPLWVVPTVWKEEYANILSKLTRKEGRNIEEVVDHYTYTLEKFNNSVMFVDPSDALEISIKYNISVYDAHFVALAIEHNCILLTEDKEVIKKCPGIAVKINDYLTHNTFCKDS